jgi:hypothetical protein
MSKNKEPDIPVITEKPPTVPKFSLEKLRENSRKLFGVSFAVFDGATYGLKGEYTKAEMLEIINKWRKKVI